MTRAVRPILIIALLTAAFTVLPSGRATGQVPAADNSGLDSSPIPDGLDKDGVGVHFQVGGLYRLATSVTDQIKQTYLVTGDLSFLHWSRADATWGAGVHFAYDDRGHRLGVKGIWRTPLKRGTWKYLQVAPGIYVSATEDTYEPKTPGYFLEAEFGLAKDFALVSAVEVLPYSRHLGGWNGEPVTEENGTATNLFFGAKIGQAGAVAATVIGLVMGIAALVSFASSGGVL